MAAPPKPYSDELLEQFATAPHGAGIGAGAAQVPMYGISSELKPAAEAWAMQVSTLGAYAA